MFLFFSYSRKRAVEEGIFASISKTAVEQGRMQIWVVAPQLPCTEPSGQPCTRSEHERCLGSNGRTGQKETQEGWGKLCWNTNWFALLGMRLRGSNKTFLGLLPDIYFCDFITIKKFMPTSYKQNRNQSQAATCLE